MTTIADLEVIIAQQAQLIAGLNETLAKMRSDFAERLLEVQNAASSAAAGATVAPDQSRRAKYFNTKFGKELCPETFSGEGPDKGGFRTWSHKTAVYMSIENRNVMDILKWTAGHTAEITSDDYSNEASTSGWRGDSGTDHVDFSADLYTFLFLKTHGSANRIVQNGVSGEGINAWRRLCNYYDPKLTTTSQHYLKLSLAIGRAKNIDDARTKIQSLEDCVRKYEEAKGRKFDEELKVTRLLEILPSDVEKHLLLENRDKEMNYHDVYTRASTYIQALTPITKDPNEMDIGNVGAERIEQDQQQQQHLNQNADNEEPKNHGDQANWDNNAWDLNALKGPKGGKGKGKFQGECYECGEYGHSAKYCPKKAKGQGGGKWGGKGQWNGKGGNSWNNSTKGNQWTGNGWRSNNNSNKGNWGKGKYGKGGKGGKNGNDLNSVNWNDTYDWNNYYEPDNFSMMTLIKATTGMGKGNLFMETDNLKIDTEVTQDVTNDVIEMPVPEVPPGLDGWKVSVARARKQSQKEMKIERKMQKRFIDWKYFGKEVFEGECEGECCRKELNIENQVENMNKTNDLVEKDDQHTEFENQKNIDIGQVFPEAHGKSDDHEDVDADADTAGDFDRELIDSDDEDDDGIVIRQYSESCDGNDSDSDGDCDIADILLGKDHQNECIDVLAPRAGKTESQDKASKLEVHEKNGKVHEKDGNLDDFDGNDGNTFLQDMAEIYEKVMTGITEASNNNPSVENSAYLDKAKARAQVERLKTDDLCPLTKSGAWSLNGLSRTKAWRTMPSPLIIDSGAAETVLPSEWFSDHPTVEATAEEKASNWFTAANGSTVGIEGTRSLHMVALDGTDALRKMEFTVCNVTKALGSVSKICSNGNRVVFELGAGNSYVENIATGERVFLRESNGVFVLDVAVAPAYLGEQGFKDYNWDDYEVKPYSDFPRQAA